MVLEEMLCFYAVLLELIKVYGGQWVVFREGMVVSVHLTEDEVYCAGVEWFGSYGNYIVDRVVRKCVVLLMVVVVYG